MNHLRKSLVYGLVFSLFACLQPVHVYAQEAEEEIPAEEISETALPENTETEPVLSSDETAEYDEMPVWINEKDVKEPMVSEPMAAGDFDYAEDLPLNTYKTVNITLPGTMVYFRFIPAESAYYTFSSDTDYYDPVVTLYMADGTDINGDDDGGSGLNCRLVNYLNKGVTYYFGVRIYGDRASFPVRLIKGGAEFTAGSGQYWTVNPGSSLSLQVDSFGETSKTTMQWYKDGKIMSGQTGSTLNLTNISSSNSYFCRCNDGYGYTEDVEFYVQVQNHLNVQIVGEYHRTVSPNSSVTMQITVSADDKSGMKTEWFERVLDYETGMYEDKLIAGASSQSYTINKVTHSAMYSAKVTDRYGNTAFGDFNIEIPNNFTAEIAGGYDKTVVYNGSITLKVTVNADDKTGMKYTWYRMDAYGEYSDGPQKVGSSASLALKNVKDPGEYLCVVTDRYENVRFDFCYVSIDNKLSAEIRGGDIISVIMYGAAYINVDVSALDKTGMTFNWYKAAYDYDVSDWVYTLTAVTDTGSYTLANIQQPTPMRVEVVDRFGNSVWLDIGINIIYDYQIAIRKDFLYLVPGQSETLIADGEPHKNWSVLDPDIATVDQNGKVTVKKVGRTLVRCYDDNNEYGDSCIVRGVFSDVKTPSAFYFNSVYWAFDNNITTGTSASTFSPNETCSRAQIVTFLWRLKGSPKVNYNVTFKDVTKDKYFYDAVAWAAYNGITTGTSATTFSPNESCTRGQIVTFLYRAMGEPNPGPAVSFEDVSADKFYYKAVCWAFNNKVTTGTSESKFSPNDKCTRAQAVTFMHRAAQLH